MVVAASLSVILGRAAGLLPECFELTALVSPVEVDGVASDVVCFVGAVARLDPGDLVSDASAGWVSDCNSGSV